VLNNNQCLASRFVILGVIVSICLLEQSVRSRMTVGQEISQNWPSFRGEGARGVSHGYRTATDWNADPAVGPIQNVLWQSKVPGVGHSSPIVFGDRVFIATAVAEAGEAPLQIGRSGKPTAADDQGSQSWVVLCYDKNNGRELWQQVAHQGKPRATRHAKATHANTSLATDGKHLLAFFGSEGLHCYDLDGKLLWRRDLGVVNISKYGIGWGYASSPAIYKNRIALTCDDPDNPYLVVLRLSDGEELYRVIRKGICVRSWSTPLIHETPTRTQIVVNGYPFIVSYDLETGHELWRIEGGGDNPVPTPFAINDHIYITNSHGGQSPIYVVKPSAQGDITPGNETEDEPDPQIEKPNENLLWSTSRGGSYMSTPVVANNLLFLGTSSIVRCFDATTGESVYEKRLETGASIIASLVAADDKIYAASENGVVYVLPATRDFEILSSNSMGQPCFATPAISKGVLYIRTTNALVAINPESGNGKR